MLFLDYFVCKCFSWTILFAHVFSCMIYLVLTPKSWFGNISFNSPWYQSFLPKFSLNLNMSVWFLDKECRQYKPWSHCSACLVLNLYYLMRRTESLFSALLPWRLYNLIDILLTGLLNLNIKVCSAHNNFSEHDLNDLMAPGLYNLFHAQLSWA